MELGDVYVNDNELDKFNQNYCHAHWPSQGMVCEVKDCGSYIYPTLRKYMRHWHRIHKEHHDLLGNWSQNESKCRTSTVPTYTRFPKSKCEGLQGEVDVGCAYPLLKREYLKPIWRFVPTFPKRK
uniref:Uncharacterized protein n=1 Tax=Magallana gigas TaxID=29159 RepID=K1PZG9_MAGGI